MQQHNSTSDSSDTGRKPVARPQPESAGSSQSGHKDGTGPDENTPPKPADPDTEDAPKAEGLPHGAMSEQAVAKPPLGN